MTKKIKVALIFSTLVAIGGLATAIFIAIRNTSVLRVGIDNNLSFNYSIKKTLNPGDETSYDFLIQKTNHTNLNLNVWFDYKQEVQDGSLYFRIIIDDKIYGEQKCNETTFDEKFTIPLEILNDTKGKMVFYLPVEVGNEAQNISYDFLTLMSLEKR